MRELDIRIIVEGAEQAKTQLAGVDKAIDGTATSTGKLDTNVGKVETSMKKLVAAVGGMAALEAGFRNLAGFVGDSVDAFVKQEGAVNRLVTALQAQGQATPAIIAQYDALAKSFERTTTFSDDLIQEMQALLVQVGNVMPGEMEAALTAVTNLASGLDIDLRTATMLVGKAFEGETGTLKRYGIVIDEAKLKAEGLPAVLEAINQKFGGQAQAELQTYGGKIENLSNQYNNLQERVGGLVATAMMPLFDAFTTLPTAMQTVVLGVGAITAILAPLAVGVAAMVIAFGTTIPLAFAAVVPFLGPVGLIAAGVLAVVLAWKNWDKIVGFAKAVYEGVKQWMVDRFNAVVQNIKDKVAAVTGFFKGMYDAVVGQSYVPDMVEEIAAAFGRLDEVMVAPTQAATGRVKHEFSDMLTSVERVLDGINSDFAQMATTAIRAFREIKIAWDKSGMTAGQKGAAIAGIAVTAAASMAGDNATGSALKGAATGIGAVTAAYMAFGAAAGPVGVAVGAVAGAVVGLVRYYKANSLHKEVNKLRDAFVDSAGGLHQLNVLAQGAGVTLTAMLDAKTPAAYKAAIDELNAALTFQDESMKFLDDTVKKYGFSLEELGPKLGAQQMAADASLLLLEFRALESAGVSVEHISLKMKDGINAYFQAALATGIAVPESMREILNQLATMGLLTDAAGTKITDLEGSGVTFAETLDTQFENLLITIRALTEAIGRGLGLAIENVPDVNVDVNRTYRNVNDPDDPVKHHAGGVILPFVQRAHRGLAIDEVPIIAQTGEGVLNRGAMGRIGGAQGLNALNAGAASAGSIVVNTTVYVDGDVNSAAVRQRLARVVNEETRKAIDKRGRVA